MRESSIENSAIIYLFLNYLPKNLIFHDIIRQQSNILRARISLIVHKPMSIHKMSGIQMQKFGNFIHMINK